jgi:protein TonB
MPIPVGGYPEIYKNISYPEAAQKAGIQGKVFVMAYVDESGKVVDCTVLRGLGAGCDEEAIKAVLSTKFSPGMNDNTKVKVKVALTIVFKLT